VVDQIALLRCVGNKIDFDSVFCTEPYFRSVLWINFPKTYGCILVGKLRHVAAMSDIKYSVSHTTHMGCRHFSRPAAAVIKQWYGISMLFLTGTTANPWVSLNIY
jgi:hypothetical protein